MGIFKKKELSEAEQERGDALLNSIKIVVNVLYALLIFQTFLILPRPDDPCRLAPTDPRPTRCKIATKRTLGLRVDRGSHSIIHFEPLQVNSESDPGELWNLKRVA